MKRIATKIYAVVFAALMMLTGLGVTPFSSYAAYNNDTTAGVVPIVFYVKDAAYCVYDGWDFYYYMDFGNNGEGEYSGGSGFFIGDPKKPVKYLVTNEHVIDSYVNANEGEQVVLFTGYYYEDYYPICLVAGSCELRVYYDQNDYDVAYVDCYGSMDKVDLAVLKLRDATTKRHALKLQLPEEKDVGSTVYTVGYPGNADNDFTGASKYGLRDATIHTGVVNKLVVNEGKGVNRIAVDATIQHGNSGGPLVNEKGNVLGINTNIESNVLYGTQVEVDYYAISTEELVRFLESNGLKKGVDYQMAGGLDITKIVIIACAVFFGLLIIAAAIIVPIVIVKSSKKKKAAAAQKQAQVQAQQQASQKRAILRSMSVQHNGMTLVVGSNPVLVGRDPATCKVVYAEGTVGVSGRHCQVQYDAATGDFIVTDLRSTYGTFLMNGQKLNANVPYRMKAGESFYVGDKQNVLRVELG